MFLLDKEQSLTFLQWKCKNAVNFRCKFLPIHFMAFSWALPSSPCSSVFEVFLDLSRFCYGIYNLIKLHFTSNNLRYVSSLIELHWRNFKENHHETASCVCWTGGLVLSAKFLTSLTDRVSNNTVGVCLSKGKSRVTGLMFTQA